MRTLIDPERIKLAGSSVFRERLQYAMRNAGDWWANHDQGGLTDTLENKIKWAKNRRRGVQVKLHDQHVNDPNLATDAIKVAKGMSFDVPGSIDVQTGQLTDPQDEVTDLNTLLEAVTGPKYEEMANLLFDFYGEDDNMTVGGN